MITECAVPKIIEIGPRKRVGPQGNYWVTDLSHPWLSELHFFVMVTTVAASVLKQALTFKKQLKETDISRSASSKVSVLPSHVLLGR
jgi:hypothetical protein